MSNHIFAISPILGSKRKLDALPADLQRILKGEGRAISSYWKNLFVQRIAATIQQLKAQGVSFTEIQYPLFRKAVEPVYATYQNRISDNLIERINRTSAVTR
jgi:TRAP-type C4-dicarboxylate transport system substrate-binding protein